jgi:hypothetical protein
MTLLAGAADALVLARRRWDCRERAEMYLPQAEAVEDTILVFFVVRLPRGCHTSQTGWQNARFHSRQDDPRSNRRGAADGERVGAEVRA